MTRDNETYEPAFLLCEIGGQPNGTRQIYFSETCVYPVDITDLCANWENDTTSPFVQITITDTSQAPRWTSNDVPAATVLREARMDANGLRLPVPYRLQPGHCLQIEVTNAGFVGFNTTTAIVARGARVLPA